MHVGINHVTIVVNDKSKAQYFYCDLLGLEKKVIGKSLWVKVGNQYIHINENPNQIRKNTFHHFAITIEGLIPFLQNLISKGVRVFDTDDGTSMKDTNTNLDCPKRNYFAYDPSGNLVEFIDSTNNFFK
ncbi:VOC family protein [Candidatus Woesebacteria bacterium]|nr:MAG: VOC family protein [Candidatus Woesebacteria bacterium]